MHNNDTGTERDDYTSLDHGREPYSSTTPRFAMIHVGSEFLIQDRQHPEVFLKIAAWEKYPVAPREYADWVLSMLNAADPA